MSKLKSILAEQTVTKSAAADVYHRDYLRTRKKRYRKYDPNRNKKPSVQTEGAFDFALGVGKHVGDKVKQSIDNTIQAGKEASVIGSISTDLKILANLLVKYDKLKQQINTSNQTPNQTNPETSNVSTSSGDVPDAFKVKEKPRMRPGQHGYEYTFSSYLYTLSSTDLVLSEGLWDFIKGASKHLGKTVAAGQEQHNLAEFSKIKKTAQETVLNIVKKLKAVPNGIDVIKKLAPDACGDLANRCVRIISSAVNKQL